MDHSNHTRLNDTDLTEANLKGADIYGPDDSKVGSVSEVHGTAPMSKVIVDVGGFLGIGAKPVAIDASRLDFMRDESGTVHGKTAMTKDQMKDLPEHKH